MNHLLSYRIFESQIPSEEILSSLKDISLDLEDNGFIVTIYEEENWGPIRKFSVRIKKDSGFDPDDTWNTIRHMTNYMSYEGFMRSDVSGYYTNKILTEIIFKFQ